MPINVEVDKGLVTLHDNFGGTIRVSLEEFQILVAKANNLVNLMIEDLQRQEAEKKEIFKENGLTT